MGSNKVHQVDHYDAQYDNFGHAQVAQIRTEAFGEDIGQTGWLTAQEQDMFIDWLGLTNEHHVLDVACGSGQPTLRIAERTGCHVTGVDLHASAIENATRNAGIHGLDHQSRFLQADGAAKLPFADAEFDALICIDAVNHLSDRRRVLQDWYRIIKPGGALLFTDPIVVTGPITNEEIAIRASIGFFLFVPSGTDEGMLQEVGFRLERVEDRTENMAKNARGWLEARASRRVELFKVEGEETFEGQQTFFATAATLAEERRLSRLAFLARKP